MLLLVLASACTSTIQRSTDEVIIEDRSSDDKIELPGPRPLEPYSEPLLVPKDKRASNPAVVALVNDAQAKSRLGKYDTAAVQLERALRIDPRNAQIWSQLASVRLHQERYQSAESMARKSNALAGSNHQLKARNWRLIANARQRNGDRAGAQEATERALELETDL